MSAINRIFPKTTSTFLASFLRTNEKSGYVVIDVDAEYSDMALQNCAKSKAPFAPRVLF